MKAFKNLSQSEQIIAIVVGAYGVIQIADNHAATPHTDMWGFIKLVASIVAVLCVITVLVPKK
jgi:hypothetical protein